MLTVMFGGSVSVKQSSTKAFADRRDPPRPLEAANESSIYVWMYDYRTIRHFQTCCDIFALFSERIKVANPHIWRQSSQLTLDPFTPNSFIFSQVNVRAQPGRVPSPRTRREPPQT